MSNFGHLKREVERLKRDLERHDEESNILSEDWHAKRAAIVDAIKEAEEIVREAEEAIKASKD